MIRFCILFLCIHSLNPVFSQNRKKAIAFFDEAASHSKFKPGTVDTAQVNKCIDLYEIAVFFDSTFFQAYRNRARLLNLIGKHEAALNDLDKAIHFAVSAERFYLFVSRAESFYHLQRYAESVRDLDLALSSGADSAYCLLLRAKAQWKSGERTEACIDLKKALLLDARMAERKEFLSCD